MKRFLFLLFFPCVLSQPWCDIGDYCNSSYLCRAELNLDQAGIVKVQANFPELLLSCGVFGEVDNSSIRVVFNNALMPHNLSSNLFFNASEPGQYFIYFSNFTENETKQQPNTSFSNEGAISTGCSVENLCRTPLQTCPQYLETNLSIFRAEITVVCEQQMMGTSCSGESVFGECSCTTGYNQGYSTLCSNSCLGNFSNGSAIGVSGSMYNLPCSVSARGTFYYQIYDFEKTIERVDSYFSYNLPEPPQITIYAPSAPVFMQAAPPIPPIEPRLELRIIAPENNTTINSSAFEMVAEIENNTKVDCSLGIDGKEVSYYFENGTIRRAFFVEEGGHNIRLTCNNTKTTKEELVLFKAEGEERKQLTWEPEQQRTVITGQATADYNPYLGLLFFVCLIIISSRRALSKARRRRENLSQSQ